MLDAIKRFALSAWLVVSLLAISFARLGSSAGSTLFSLIKIFNFFNKGNYKIPAFLPVALFMMVGNLVLNLGTRIPAVYHMVFKMKPKKTVQEETKPLLAEEDEEVEDSFQLSERSQVIEEDFSEEKAKTIRDYLADGSYITLRALGLCSSGFVALNSLLGFVTIYSFLVTDILGNPEPFDEENPDKEDYSVYAVCVVLMVAAYLSYIAYNLKKYNHNAAITTDAIKTGELNLDKKTAHRTFWLSFFAVICVPLLGYFSTRGSLEKIPKWSHLKPDETTAFGIAIFSAVTATINYVFTSVFSSYRKLSQTKEEYEHHPCWEGSYKRVMYTTGVVDNIGSMASNYIATLFVLYAIFGQELEGPNKDDPRLYAACVPTLFAGILYFIFNIGDGIQNTLGIYHDRRGDAPIKNPPPAPEYSTRVMRIEGTSAKGSSEELSESDNPVSSKSQETEPAPARTIITINSEPVATGSNTNSFFGSTRTDRTNNNNHSRSTFRSAKTIDDEEKGQHGKRPSQTSYTRYDDENLLKAIQDMYKSNPNLPRQGTSESEPDRSGTNFVNPFH